MPSIDLYRLRCHDHSTPFHPGYGSSPEVLAGRDDVRDALRRQLQSGESVHHAFYGPRGIGKTVLLTEFGQWAAGKPRWHVIRHRMATDQQISLALVDRLADPSHALTRRWDRLVESLRSNLTVRVSGPVAITKSFDASKAAGPVDTLLERALVRMGRDAAAQHTAVLLLLDEIHTPRPGSELERLSNALQAVKEQELPVHALVAVLRPVDSGGTRGATFLERLESTSLRFLAPAEARLALVEPWARRGVATEAAALDRLVVAADGYPYFIQLFGARTHDRWVHAGGAGAVTADHADHGIRAARDSVNALYRGRLDRLSPESRAFVVTMATVAGDQPARISEIGKRLGRAVTALSPIRETLIERHQLIEPAGRGLLQFVLPWYGSWLTGSIDELPGAALRYQDDPAATTQSLDIGNELDL